MRTSFEIVAVKHTAATFAEYCRTFSTQAWVEKIVLHNTGNPPLAGREGGVLTKDHIENLHTYYEGLGWKGGPHLFVDATGIWVFNPLDREGRHSPSYNQNTWGVEMLGNYETESFTTGLGLLVAKNAKAANAALAKIQAWENVDGGRLILHKEDPATDHDCPGKEVVKADFIAGVNEIISKGSFQGMKYDAYPAAPDATNVVIPRRW